MRLEEHFCTKYLMETNNKRYRMSGKSPIKKKTGYLHRILTE